MRKILAKIMTCLFVTSLSCGMFAACSPQVEDSGIQLNPNKETINISMYVAGFGSEYMKTIINKWNAEHADKNYQFNISMEHTDPVATIEDKISNGIKDADIYLNDDSGLHSLKNSGQLLDLTPVWTSEPDGDGVGFEEKLRDVNMYKELYTGTDNKIYAIPWTQGVTGMLYDHDFFVEEGWLLEDSSTENGLTKGTDGIEGTFDDGLPSNVAEFRELCELISNTDFYPFIVSDKVPPWIDVLETVMARYIGVESYITSYTLNGKYIDPATGAVTVITPQDGYRYNQINEGLKKGFDFLDEYIFSEDYRDAYIAGIDHIQQGERFIYSHNYTRIAMFFDGCWWEREKKFAFDSDAQRHGTKWGYGKRDIRYMPIPAYEGATSELEGKNVFITNNVGSIFALKSEDEEKNQAIIEFLTDLVTNESLKEFTNYTNCMTAYKCNMNEDELAALTPFGRNMYEIMNSDNVVIVHPTVYKQQSLFYTSISIPYTRFGITFNGISYTDAFAAVAVQKRCTTEEYYEALINRYDEESWKTVYNALVF